MKQSKNERKQTKDKFLITFFFLEKILFGKRNF